MTGQTNTGGGSIGAQRKATIVVTYPSGSTCTVTNGSQTYTALDTSGAAAFIVEPGTWTVKAVSGSRSVSKSVTVTAGGWIEVELSFSLELFPVTSASTIWQSYSGPSPLYPALVTITDTSLTIKTANGNDDGGVITKTKYSMSNRSNVRIKVSYTSEATDGNNQIALFISSSNGSEALTNAIAKAQITSGTDKTVTLDVSAVTDSCYIGIGVDTIGGTRTLTVKEVEVL